MESHEDKQSASIYLNGGQHGDYSASLYRSDTENQFTVNANGGLVWMDNQLFSTPTLQNAFAVVDTSSFRGVGVRSNGVEHGKSNSNGVYIIPDLPSYTESTIGISPDIAMNLKEMDTSFKVMPAYRSGELLKFDIEPIHYVLAHIKDPQGKPLEAGTAVEVYTSSGEERSVLGNGGLLYLSTTSQSLKVVVLTGEQKGETIEGHYTPNQDMVVHLSKLAITHAPKIGETSQNNIAIATNKSIGREASIDREMSIERGELHALRSHKEQYVDKNCLANHISPELMEYRSTNFASKHVGYFEQMFSKYRSYFVGERYVSTQIVSDNARNA